MIIGLESSLHENSFSHKNLVNKEKIEICLKDIITVTDYMNDLPLFFFQVLQTLDLFLKNMRMNNGFR